MAGKAGLYQFGGGCLYGLRYTRFDRERDRLNAGGTLDFCEME